MIYTYTVDLPHTDASKNRREYYRLPRSVLLPPYLLVNPYFVEYTDSIDEVFDATIEHKLEGLRNIRNMWATNKTTEAKISDQAMVEFIDWGGTDRATVVKQVNLLGLRLSNANLVDENSYRTLSRFLGLYWFEKGKNSAVDFLNFCLGTDFEIQNLFTQDYATFHPETDAIVGAKVYDDPPGPWYPTTHVRLTVPGAYRVDPITTANFFYEIANYNLVLEMLQAVFEGIITSRDSLTHAEIVCMAISKVETFSFASDHWNIPIVSQHSNDFTLIDAGLTTYTYFNLQSDSIQIIGPSP